MLLLLTVKLLIKPGIFNILINYSSLNNFSKLIPHMSQITEKNLKKIGFY